MVMHQLDVKHKNISFKKIKRLWKIVAVLQAQCIALWQLYTKECILEYFMHYIIELAEKLKCSITKCLNNFQSEGISTSSIFAYAQLTEPVNMSPLSTRSSSFPFLSRSFTMFRCITSLTSSSCSRRISSTLFVFRILFIRTNSFSSLLSGSVLLRSSKLRHRFSSERRHVCCNTGKIFKIGHSNN